MSTSLICNTCVNLRQGKWSGTSTN